MHQRVDGDPADTDDDVPRYITIMVQGYDLQLGGTLSIAEALEILAQIATEDQLDDAFEDANVHGMYAGPQIH